MRRFVGFGVVVVLGTIMQRLNVEWLRQPHFKRQSEEL